MKNIYKILIVLIVTTSCEQDDNIKEDILRDSFLPDNATNVSLRPTFGFSSSYGLNDSYTINCDTIMPPEQVVAKTSGNISNLMCMESKMLKSNKKYYWYCNVERKGKYFPTETFSFTTIDTSILNGNHWQSSSVLSKTNYEQKNARDYYSYYLPIAKSFIYSEPYAFTISNDSVKNVFRQGFYNQSFKGGYHFNFDTVTITDWKYQFINLGVNYFYSHNNQGNNITLVLKQPYSDNVIIFNKHN